MAQKARRFTWIARLSRVVMLIAVTSLCLAIVWTISTALYVLLAEPAPFDAPPPWQVASTAGFAVLFQLVGIGVVILAYGLVQVILANEVSVTESASRLGRLESLLESESQGVTRLVELSTLSEKAKSLVYRDRELEAFREAIQEDIIRQDYETAMKLIEDIEERFGYTEEAERLRAHVRDSQKASADEVIENNIHRVQELLSRQDWDQALRASRRLQQAFPDSDQVAKLPQRVEAARTKHKRALLQEYGEAVRRDDVDRGIELLRELDRYLSPQEAAALEESARGVFRKKLHNLGVQFAISVADQQWADAVVTGEEIVNEFPNTRMAQEVREKLDLLKTRAAGNE
mgnify:CR=1 FL=1